MNILMWENSITKHKPEDKIPKCKNTYNLRNARTRIRVIQEFLCFCCHKCHTVICIILFFRLLRDYQGRILTNKRFNRGKYAGEDNEIGHFFALIAPKIVVFPPTFSPCVTLVTAKKQHRCWKARARTRMHARESSAIVLPTIPWGTPTTTAQDHFTRPTMIGRDSKISDIQN